MKTLLMLPLLAAMVLVCNSCAGEHGSATPGFWKEALPGDPAAKFGILISSPYTELPAPVAAPVAAPVIPMK
jgi:hypothetical protein